MILIHLSFVLRDDANNMKRNVTDQNEETGDVGGLWSTCRGSGSCQRPCNPPPETPALHSTLSSRPPHHDKPDLHSITEPQATSPLPSIPSFSFSAVLIPFVIYTASVSVSLTGTGRPCQARPRGSEPWQGVASVSPWWPNLEKRLNGFRHIC